MRKEEENNKIRRLLKSLMDKEHEITEHQTNISNIKQYASELQTFLALKHIENDVLVDEQYIQSMINSDGANQINVLCQINPSLQGLLSDIEKFGDIVITADPCRIPIMKQKDKQAQIMVASKPIIIDSLKPALLQSFDTNLLFATGCVLLPDCRMVFACNVYKMIRVLKPDGSPEFEIRNFGTVFDVAIIGDNSVAVTTGYDFYAYQIIVIDLKTRKIKKGLTVNLVNTGLAYSEDKLIYCAGGKGVQMISLNDESISNITKTSVSDYSCVATFGDEIFYTNCKYNNVTCADFQGKTRWMFKNETVLKSPFGISVDRDGNIYVVGKDSNNLVVISSNGQNYRELLTSENGLEAPVIVNVEKSSCKILVTNRKGKAFVYSLV
ncbi:uncharacterized protein LOC134683737 [Mytilus trossulus]|uniref:uncharacterized protein LOC134683737 n=1 Tax=Mytilus trossulus TaxID=6551 RepID=UPI003007067E